MYYFGWSWYLHKEELIVKVPDPGTLGPQLVEGAASGVALSGLQKKEY